MPTGMGSSLRGGIVACTVLALVFGQGAIAAAQTQRTGPIQRGGRGVSVAPARLRSVVPLTITCGSGTNNWTGTAGNNQWATAGNWSTGAVPISTDNVCIASSFSSTITVGTLAAGNQSISSLNDGAPISFTSGPLTITGTATFAADLAISNGTLTLNGTSSMTTLELSGGTLSGTGTLTVSGLLTWSGGTHGGSGTTNANGGMAISGEPFLDTRTMNNAGTATWNGSVFFILDGAVFNNKTGATWNHQGDTQIEYDGGATPTFNNAGTFEKTSGTGTGGGGVGSNIVFDNTGSVQANSGILLASDNGSCTGTCGGTWSVASGATLQLGSGATAAALSGPISGAGTVNFSTGTVNYTGTYNVTGGTQATNGTANFNTGATVTTAGVLTISNGTLNFSTGKAVTTSALTQSAGTLTGSDTLTVSGLLTWSGGTESGSGTTDANGGMAISGEPFLNTRTMNNAKTATWNGSVFFMLDGAVFNNKTGATWNHQGDTQIEYDGGATPTFNNAGTFEKTSGTGASGGGVGGNINFKNSGTVIAKSGTLLLGNFFTQSKGSVLLEGGNVSLPGSSTLTETGGSVLGIGTITGGLTNSGGIVSPTLTTGAPATGTLTVNGSGAGYYTQGAGGTLLLDVAGSGAGQFDVLSASGAASLAGSAQLCLIKGFKPTAGTMFSIMSYGSETGTFSTVNFGWSLAYGATSLVATYNGAPADSFSPAMLSFPSQLINTASSGMSVTLTNVGGAALTINSINIEGTNKSDYMLTTNTCGATLAAGAKCTMTVTFTPSGLGSRSANITVADNACSSPHIIPLTGKGTEITMAPSPVNFGSQAVGTTSAPMTVTLTNHGTTAVKVSAASVTGPNKGDFKITSNGCTTIPASGGTCTINLTFTPGAKGARNGALSVTDNDKGSPQTDALEGTGT